MSENEQEEEEDEGAPVKQPTSSEICFTPEERQLRRQYRNSKSQCCVKEAWKLYDKLTDKPKDDTEKEEAGTEKEDEKPEKSDLKRMGVVYDPTMDRRRRYLKQKFAYLKNTLNIIKEAPEKPYMRPNEPHLIDIPGQKFIRPLVTRTFRPEIFRLDAMPPEKALASIAYTKQWLNISNLNFDVVRKMKNQTTITSARQILKCLPIEKSRDDGRDILPMPTAYVLSTIWDRTSLYCCQKYQEMIEEAAALEAFTLRERSILDVLIDIRPHAKQSAPQAVESKIKEDKGGDEEDKLEEQTRRPRSPRPSKYVRALVEKRRLSYEDELRYRKKDKAIDTFDLPWDPFESRFQQPNPFSDAVFDDPRFHAYYHAEVVMKASEIFQDLEPGGDIALAEGDSDSSNKSESQ